MVDNRVQDKDSRYTGVYEEVEDAAIELRE